MTQTAVNPATGEPVGGYEQMTMEDAEEILDQAHEAFLSWRNVPFSERARLMKEVARILVEKKSASAQLMAEEMGKPIRQGEAEVDKCRWVCEYYAENAEKFLTDEPVHTDAFRSFVTFQPIGVVAAIMPWNFPFWQVFRFAAPNLMAGNAVLLKHAGNVPGCALAIEEAFLLAGFPDDLFRVLFLESDRMNQLLENPKVSAVTLTGSPRAGRAVARTAGSMLKKTVLELGGSDPYLILEDADIEFAAKTCVASRLINSGQSCIAAKRFVVVDGVCDEFERRFVKEMKKKKMGNPLEEGVDIGPLAREDLRDELHRQVSESIKRGAKCLLGGKVPEQPGFYYPPTVLSGVEKGMPAYEEELFGPVAAIIRASDEEDAIEKANDSVFGLGAAVFTRDRERGEAIASEDLAAGSCFVNSMVKSDPRLPFGGIKESGYGRELGKYGIREFVNIKTVWIE